MTAQIKQGSLEDFLKSVQETAKEIDTLQKITPKHNLWVAQKPLPFQNLMDQFQTLSTIKIEFNQSLIFDKHK